MQTRATNHKALRLAVCFFCFSVGVSHAQAPQRTSVTYDDWTVFCITAPGPKGDKVCEMVQSQIRLGQLNAVGQITIKPSSKNEPMKLFAQVPANVWLQAGMKFTSGDKRIELPAAFRWCIPTRCLADTELNETAVKKLREQTRPGLEAFKDASQRLVTLPVSFKGFAPALNWMEKQ